MDAYLLQCGVAEHHHLRDAERIVKNREKYAVYSIQLLELVENYHKLQRV
jgi:hypothetical protein